MRDVVVLGALSLAVALVPAEAQQSPADFYRGKTITFGIPSSAGGGYDAYARLVTQYLPKYVPGNPSVVAQNVPAAGGMMLTNMLYSTAPKDGTYIGIVRASTLYEQVFGNDAAKFDGTKFNWLGNLNSTQDTCVFSAASGVGSPMDAMANQHIIGASGTGAMAYSLPTIYNEVLGTKFKIVMGYTGVPDRILAMEQREIDGGCGIAASTLKATLGSPLKEGKIQVAFQAGMSKDPDLPNVPNILDYAKSSEARMALEFLFVQLEINIALAAPPGVSEDRVAALRTAFNDMIHDPEVVKEAQALKLDFQPMDSAKTLQVVERLFAMPKPVVEKIRTALTRH